jgi:hypothetical protein
MTDRLESHGAVSDRGVPFGVEHDEGLSLAVEHIKPVFDALRVEALINIGAPLSFEGLRDLNFKGEA